MSELGPCMCCGAKGYELSSGGPTICPSCDCGIDPEISSLRNARRKLARENKLLTAEIASLHNDKFDLEIKRLTTEQELAKFKVTCPSQLQEIEQAKQQGIKEGMLRAQKIIKELWKNSTSFHRQRVLSDAADYIRDEVNKL